MPDGLAGWSATISCLHRMRAGGGNAVPASNAAASGPSLQQQLHQAVSSMQQAIRLAAGTVPAAAAAPGTGSTLQPPHALADLKPGPNLLPDMLRLAAGGQQFTAGAPQGTAPQACVSQGALRLALAQLLSATSPQLLGGVAAAAHAGFGITRLCCGARMLLLP